jgi:hypothetical protein
MPTTTTMSRELSYDDGSGPRVKVSFDSALRLGNDDISYVRIQGVGEDTLVGVNDIPFVIDALQEAARLDAIARAENDSGEA